MLIGYLCRNARQANFSFVTVQRYMETLCCVSSKFVVKTFIKYVHNLDNCCINEIEVLYF